MYRLVKIKAFTLILAWSLIFLHNIIPHIHIEDQPHFCHSIFHKVTAVHHHNEHETEVAGNCGQNDHTEVCHFTVIFCHSHASTDFLTPSASSDNRITIPDHSESLFVPDSENHPNPSGQESQHLRAPPLS